MLFIKSEIEEPQCTEQDIFHTKKKNELLKVQDRAEIFYIEIESRVI